MAAIPKHIFWMSRALEQGLTRGVEVWAEDTQERSNWLNQDKDARHVIAGTMLVGCLAYVEGQLGLRWWNNMNSAASKRDLDILWIVRNAFVHKDSVPKDLSSTSPADLAKIAIYCQDLQDGRILDDKGNVYPVYMELSGDRVLLNENAIRIFAGVFETAYRAFK